MSLRELASGDTNRYNQFCTSYGCFAGIVRDDFENPWPSLAYGGLISWPDPRIPAAVRDAFCGPFGCALPQPLLPSAVSSYPLTNPFRCSTL